MNADAINAALDAIEQSALLKAAKEASNAGGPRHFFSDRDTFDRIPGGMVARRNNHTVALVVPAEGEYGA